MSIDYEFIIEQAIAEEWGELKLRTKGLTHIPLSLCRLKSLRSLDLSGNAITYIPSELNNLGNLRSLNISNNQLITLHPHALRGLSNLEALDLSGNQLKEIPKDIEGLSNLKYLYLIGNQLKYISEEIGKLSDLQYLYAWKNEITELPLSIGKLKNLIHLDLSENNLKNLPIGIGELKNLSILNLKGNFLTTLPKEIKKLTLLKELDLSKNNFVILPPVIGHLANLRYLDVCDNEIEKIPASIGNLKKLSELNLSSNKLSTLPKEIGESKSIEILDVAQNNLISLPEQLGDLKDLKFLYCKSNKIKDLQASLCKLKNLKLLDLNSNHIEIIPKEISNLINLETLDLCFNKLESLPPEIGQLQSLQKLFVTNNYLSGLPKEIGRLTNLVSLFAGRNEITDLPEEFKFLKKLEKLVLGDELNDGDIIVIPSEEEQGNLLSEIPDWIGELTSLKSLYISGNQIKSVPIEIQLIPDLQKIRLSNNPLRIPLEILNQIQPQVVLNYYFTLLIKSKSPINEAKLILIGEGSVGKTSLIFHILHNKFKKDSEKTDGISISQWVIEKMPAVQFRQAQKQLHNQKIRLNIWDFGGQEIMHATHQFFLTKRSIYLLVVDTRNSQEQNQVEYWLKIIQSFGGESPVLIVGNKIDQHPLDIDRIGLQKKYPNIVRILETSATTGAGVEDLKLAIIEQVVNLPHINDLMPEPWFVVKSKLEELGRAFNFIAYDKYFDLCAKNKISDEISQRTLLGFLHDLGVILCFQEEHRLAELGILNPQWVTNGVYKILNDKTLFANKGVLSLSLLDEILIAPDYPKNKRLFIVDMMKKFELCYDIEPDKTFLVPDLLPKDEPAELKFNGVPAFEYAYPVLPSSVITRFIVRMNQKIENHFVWRTGVVLKIGDNKALVKADIEDRKITIAIDGQEHTRRDALSAIRYQLDEIHESIKGLDAQKYVPIPNAPNAEPLEYETLLMLEREGQEEYLVRDGKRLVKVIVRQILSGIETESARKESGNRVTNIYIGGDVKDSNILAGDDNEVKK